MTTLAPDTRIRVHRTHGNRTAFIKTGTVLAVFSDGVIHFQDDAGPRVHLATNAQLQPLGQAQTLTVLTPSASHVAAAA